MDESVEEIEELAASANYEIAYEIIQRRDRPEPTTFLGRGKIAEVLEVVGTTDVCAVIVNGNLRPSHHYALENALKLECIDRIRLVLEIFMLRANSKESRLQVERARLRYEVPLLREWIHSAKKGEHPGFLGGGEYAVDVYYDLIKKRMRRIDEELRKMREASGQRTGQRRRRGFGLVSLAGYTNAGKSSLMRALTGEDVVVEDRMFSTLSTTTKRLKDSPLPILVTDTIGFLHDLPPFVIEAFKNTITEIFTADLILLVIDASESEEEMERKLSTSERIIFPEVEPNRILLVLNKADCLDEEGRRRILERMRGRVQGSPTFLVSAKDGQGLMALQEEIKGRFSFDVEFEAVLPQASGTQGFLAWLRSHASISPPSYTNEVRVRGTCRGSDLKRIEMKVRALNGQLIIMPSTMPA